MLLALVYLHTSIFKLILKKPSNKAQRTSTKLHKKNNIYVLIFLLDYDWGFFACKKLLCMYCTRCFLQWRIVLSMPTYDIIIITSCVMSELFSTSFKAIFNCFNPQQKLIPHMTANPSGINILKLIALLFKSLNFQITLCELIVPCLSDYRGKKNAFERNEWRAFSGFD